MSPPQVLVLVGAAIGLGGLLLVFRDRRSTGMTRTQTTVLAGVGVGLVCLVLWVLAAS